MVPLGSILISRDTGFADPGHPLPPSKVTLRLQFSHSKMIDHFAFIFQNFRARDHFANDHCRDHFQNIFQPAKTRSFPQNFVQFPSS